MNSSDAPSQTTPTTTELPNETNKPLAHNNASVDLIDIDYLLKVKFRVGTIESAEPIPKSKKLLKLMVNLGELGTRQILSGIALCYSAESLIGRQIIVVENLKPAKFMGQESHGMLLAAGNGDQIALLQPDQQIQNGSLVR